MGGDKIQISDGNHFNDGKVGTVTGYHQRYLGSLVIDFGTGSSVINPSKTKVELVSKNTTRGKSTVKYLRKIVKKSGMKGKDFIVRTRLRQKSSVMNLDFNDFLTHLSWLSINRNNTFKTFMTDLDLWDQTAVPSSSED